MAETDQKSLALVKVLEMPETLNREWVENSSIIREKPTQSLVLDFSKTRIVDSAGLSMVYYLNRLYAKGNKKIVLRNIPDVILSSLKNWQPTTDEKTDGTRTSFGFFANVGEGAWKAKEVAVQALSMFAEIFYWGSFGLIKKRDFRRGVLFEQMFFMGYKSIGIVCSARVFNRHRPCFTSSNTAQPIWRGDFPRAHDRHFDDKRIGPASDRDYHIGSKRQLHDR